MPVKVRKELGKYVVVDARGKRYGKHGTKVKAERQKRAININMKGK